MKITLTVARRSVAATVTTIARAATGTTNAQAAIILPTAIAMQAAANLKTMVIVAGSRLLIARKAGPTNLI